MKDDAHARRHGGSAPNYAAADVRSSLARLTLHVSIFLFFSCLQMS